MSGRRTRLDRLARQLPPPPAPRAPDALTPEQLRAMPTEELLARFEARLRTPEALARQAELAAMSDEQLVAEWERLPRYRDGRGGRRR